MNASTLIGCPVMNQGPYSTPAIELVSAQVTFDLACFVVASEYLDTVKGLLCWKLLRIAFSPRDMALPKHLPVSTARKSFAFRTPTRVQ